ncbi:MAG TPA: hypothetical protein VEH62_05545 [Gemmatimonadales bacterium]|nr:hypothetical protein [Gemmatimonadales bacterium]
MKINKNWGMIVLAVWLILHGILVLTQVSFPAYVSAILALIAGILILFFDKASA